MSNVLDECWEAGVDRLSARLGQHGWSAELEGPVEGARMSFRAYGSGSSQWIGSAVEAALEDFKAAARGERDE